MPEIVTCQCGARIRLPEVRGSEVLRCPRCKAELIPSSTGAIVVSKVSGAESAGTLCPICQTVIQPAEAVLTCPDCEQVHHKECWAEVGGCATYGCKHAPAVDKAAPTVPLTAWGDTKKCPACGEMIKAIALRCRYCGTDFDTVDPLTVRDLRGQVEREIASKQARRSVVALFIFTIVVPCVAPLMMIISLAWVLPNRRKLSQAGPFYAVLGYSSIVLSVLYSILMLLFWLFSEH